jgi:hypothetical protein
MASIDPVDELAVGHLDALDEQLLRRIATTFEAADPVPPGLVSRIQFGITMDALHAEIAQLQRVGAEAVGARADGAAEAQTVTFTSASVTTMVTIRPIGAQRVRIDGWAAPGAGLGVELRIVGGLLRTEADSDGRFVFEDVPRGLAQFVLRAPQEALRPPVITPSIEL